MIGETIREFEIQSELGSGGYGVVYRAHDTSVDRDVAIKVILPQYANKPEFIAAFESEARLVAQLEHKDIVPLYAYWRDDRGAFLVMRYIRGGSLRGMIAKQGALPLNKVLRLIEQIADALYLAHEAGVIHRDLKPDNILIDERGNAYLTDFGIAKQITRDGHSSATDAIKGTFAYLSPEQIQQAPVSPQTDIYAFGVMLYEMLSGKHPFHDTPIGMMVVKHLREALPDVRDVREDLSGAINDIIQKATAKEPAERYTTTLDLVANLQQALSGVSAVPVKQSAPAKAKPTTSEERNRQAMLENVRKFWIEGVLENSLHDAAMIDLGMKAESGVVDNPWDTLLRTPSGDETLSNESIVHVFDRMNGKLLILGDPGSGKTTTLLTLARDLLARAETDDQHPIPVVFNLSSWSENQPPLADWLVEELNGKYQVPRKVAAQWLENDELLLLLDGLDEVSEAARNACVLAVNTYRGEHGFVDVVVCSRIKDYEALTDQLKLNGAIVIQPLTDQQVIQYLDGLGADTQVMRELIIRDAQLRELAQSPLMLSIMVLAYRGKSITDVPDFDDVEEQRQHLFEVYVQRMFDRRIGERPYTPEETRHHLGWLARKMQQHAQSLFNIEDLQPIWLADAQRIITFPNRIRFITTVVMGLCFLVTGLSWYIAAGNATPFMVVCYALTGMVYGYLFAHDLVLGDNWFTHHFAGILIGGLLGISFGVGSASISDVPMGLFFGALYGSAMAITAIPYHLRWVKRFRTSTTSIVPLERVEYSLRFIQWERVVIGLMFQLISGFIVGIAIFPDQMNFESVRVVIALIFGFMLVVGFNIYMDAFTALDVQMRLRPNEGMFATIQNMIRFTFATVVIIGALPLAIAVLGVNISAVLWAWLALAVQHGSDTILSHGGIPLIQHLYLRYQLQRENAIPTNLADFLDYSAALILMRKVGGGYIFIHRYLLEYFADLEDNHMA